ncbi:MAG: hypothetical protein US74_C0008G0029 [Parcubacteria group bacterium GW2011_GWA2_38_13]|nr:MAG: hypothetical protein US74_C0008G0029 [Parcubacteria group bacterium GW2011_GWA2_38_13]
MKNKKPTLSKQFKFYNSPIFVVLIFTILMAAFFIISYEASAQIRESVTNGFGYASSMGLGARDLRTIIFAIINVLLGFLSIVAVLIIMYGGFVWMTSKGDPKRVDDAKNILKNAVIGLVIIFLAFSIVQFVFRFLLGAVTPPGAGNAPPPPGGCVNCSALGGGIIETVFPANAARDVPRDTMIFVTFKEVIQTDTIIRGGGVSGDLMAGENNVQISYTDPVTKLPVELGSADVVASSGDNKTFSFRPDKYLGDGKNNIIYSVRLGKDILKEGVDIVAPLGFNDPAFQGPINYYKWWFEVGTRLDLIPPKISNVAPDPEVTGIAGKDNYSPVAPVASFATITVTKVPQTYVAPVLQGTVDILSGSATIIGTVTETPKFAGKSNVKICLTGAANQFSITQVAAGSANCAGVAPAVPLDCLNATTPLVETSIIGCGLSVNFNESPAIGNQFIFSVTAAIPADTLQVANTTYTFVLAAPAGNQILAGGGINGTVTNIINKISSVAESPNVNAEAVVGFANRIKFVAAIKGVSGDSIQISSSAVSGDWINLPSPINLSGGVDALMGRSIVEIPDESRDVIIKINFSEPMFPPKIGGVVATQGNNPDSRGMGQLLAGDFSAIEVFADLNNNFVSGANPEPIEHVAGTWRISNNYKTAEFISNLSCGICPDGLTPCNNDTECGGGACSVVKNSCGDIKKCLPVKGDVTHYIVRVNTANLINTCAGSNDNCKDERFNICGADNVCEDAGGINYPKAREPIDGVVDAAANSMDGNRNDNTQGPLPAPNTFYIDVPTLINPAQGDSYQWEFNINKTIDMTPPEIEARGPDQDQVVSPIYVPSAQFNKRMMMSTFKPDNSYPDGLCNCAVDADCVSATDSRDEYCDNTFKVCRRKDNAESFCRYDSQCKRPALKCRNQEYVTLIDSLKRTGYWIVGEDIDTNGDSFADKSIMRMNQTGFIENAPYHIDIGSGLRDYHQNCFMPGKGPGCNPTSDLPFCCYGVPTAPLANGDSPCLPATKS